MIHAILLAGGTGTRVGTDIPKQYVKANGRMIIEYSLETILKSDLICSLTIVASEEWTECIKECIGDNKKFSGFASPGDNRQLSIYNGLCAIKDIANSDDYVFIHDAARPNIQSDLIERMYAVAKDADGVLPVLAMKDTVYKIDENGRISSLLDRQLIVAGQAPEMFLFGKYLEANEKLIADGRIKSINGSTEPAFLHGMNIVTIAGDDKNYKITTKTDLERFCEEML